MKIILALLISITTQAQEINLTNRVATFTNLEGRVYKAVHVVKGTADGIVYREQESTGGGLVSYTNLAPALLAAWGIPLDRMEKARLRAASKAVQDAKFRAFQQQAARGDPARATPVLRRPRAPAKGTGSRPSRCAGGEGQEGGT